MQRLISPEIEGIDQRWRTVSGKKVPDWTNRGLSLSPFLWCVRHFGNETEAGFNTTRSINSSSKVKWKEEGSYAEDIKTRDSERTRSLDDSASKPNCLSNENRNVKLGKIENLL